LNIVKITPYVLFKGVDIKQPVSPEQLL